MNIFKKVQRRISKQCKALGCSVYWDQLREGKLTSPDAIGNDYVSFELNDDQTRYRIKIVDLVQQFAQAKETLNGKVFTI